MRRVKTRPLAAALVVLAAAVTVAACTGGTRQSGGRHKLDLKIGNLVPLSGAQESIGLAGQKAANLALEQVRTAIKDVKANHTVTMSNQNYRSEPTLAQDLASRLHRQGYSCLVGPYSAGDLIPVANTVSVPKKVLEITPGATADVLSSLQVGGYVNRTVAPDRLQGPALAQVVADSLGRAKGKKVSIGAYKSLYGNDLVVSFSDAWKKMGGKISARVVYEPNLPSYRKQAEELVAKKPDAYAFFDFGDTYQKITTELLKTHKWKPTKSFATDSLAISGYGQGGGALVEGLRGVAPGAPRFGANAEAFQRLYDSGPPPKFRQPFDAQTFDAVVLCYLSAVAAGSTKGSRMADRVRLVSSPPGKQYTWRQLPEAIKALESGKDIDYQGASGPIDMNKAGNPTAGFYDVYRYKDVRLQIYGLVSVPPSGKGIQQYPAQFITPAIPGVNAPPVTPKGATGATGASGASGAGGASGAAGKKSKQSKKRKKR